MSGNLVEKLAHEVPNIVGMKDTSGDITQTSEFIRRNRDVDFKVFGGKDTLLPKIWLIYVEERLVFHIHQQSQLLKDLFLIASEQRCRRLD